MSRTRLPPRAFALCAAFFFALDCCSFRVAWFGLVGLGGICFVEVVVWFFSIFVFLGCGGGSWWHGCSSCLAGPVASFILPLICYWVLLVVGAISSHRSYGRCPSRWPPRPLRSVPDQRPGSKYASGLGANFYCYIQGVHNGLQQVINSQLRTCA